MGLNIKNDETERLIRELAAMRGESLTEAVTEAVREALAREKQAQSREERLRRMMEISKACAAALPPSPKQDGPYVDPAAFLYDEMGLPK